jgi:hypothetical protein
MMFIPYLNQDFHFGILSTKHYARGAGTATAAVLGGQRMSQ